MENMKKTIKKQLIEASPGNIASFNKMIKSTNHPIILYSILSHHTEKENEIIISDLVVPFLEDKEHKGIRKDVIKMLKNITSKLENQRENEMTAVDLPNSSATTCEEIPINPIINEIQ